MSNEQKPSAEALEAASKSLAMLQTVSDPDFAYLARRVAVEIDRVRREARAEAFEEAALKSHLNEGNNFTLRDVLRALAAKERAS